jgi:hypothetical protein
MLAPLKRNCPECGRQMELVRPDPRCVQFVPFWDCNCGTEILPLTASERLLLEDAPQLPGMEP